MVERSRNTTSVLRRLDEVRKNVNQNVSLQYPIVFDQYYICQLVRDNELKKTYNQMCLKLGLAIPNPPVRRNTPYEHALKEAVALCSCIV